MTTYQKLQNIAFITFSVLILMGLVAYNIWSQDVPINEIKDYTSSLGIWTPVAFIALYTMITIFIPSTPFMAIAGILFGFKYGLLYTVIGGILSAVFVFYLSRILGSSFTEKILKHEKLKRFDEYSDKIIDSGIWTLIVLRIMPIMPFNVLNLLMGISKIKIRDYLLGTIIGLAPSNVIVVYFGSFIFTEVAQRMSWTISLVVIVFVIVFIYKNTGKYFKKD